MSSGIHKLEKQEDEQYETASNDLAKQPTFGSVQDADEEPDLHWRSWIVVFACGFYYAATLIVLLSTGFWLGVITKDIGGAATGLWYLMIGGLTLGCVGCAVIATAKSMNVAILGTVIYGFDWCLVSSAFSIASEVTTRRWRPRAQSFLNVCGSTGIIFAVFAGAGFILHEPGGYAGWRDCFWLAFGMLFVADCLFIFFYHPAPAPNPRNLTVMARILECDLTAPWKSAQVLAPLLIGIGFLGVFIYHQVFIQKHGLLNHSMFKGNRNVAVSIFGIYYGEVTGILYEARTLFLATRFSTFLFANITGSIFVQWFSYKYKSVKSLLVGGYFLFLVGMIGMATLKANSPLMSKLAVAWAAIAGFGFSAPIALLIATAQLGVEPQYIGLVSGLLISARSVGGAIGVAIATAVWEQKLTVALPAYIAKAAVKAGLPETSLVTFVTGIATNNVTPAILMAGGAAALDAYAYALKYIWIVVIPFVVIAMLSCLFLTGVSDSMNYLVDRPTEAIHHADHLEEKNTPSARFTKAVALFEAAHATDPSLDSSSIPESVTYHASLAEYATKLSALAQDGGEPSEALLLAAHSQHIRRWEKPRNQWAEGLSGYKTWRTTLNRFHAQVAEETMLEAGYDGEEDKDLIARVKDLLLKKNLARPPLPNPLKDPEMQLFEDAICLVFLKLQFVDFAAKLSDEEKMVGIVRKTWAKMTDVGRGVVAGELVGGLPEDLKVIVGKALA
ncbi:hypothetical protein RQP46_006274 [Phenoliferia psychrophenolica]